jgi:hypothetical protein
MKKIFYSAMTFFFLLPLALSAQEFNPAAGPLEGIWINKDDEEELIIFVGNLFLEKDGESTYMVLPGMKYRNGKAQSSAEPDYAFNYKLSGNTLTLTDEYDDDTIYKRSGDGILQNKSALEGIWTAPYSDSDITGVMTWICVGRLVIMSMEILAETDSLNRHEYMGFEFTYSDTDNTITLMGDSVSCKVSGNTMTLSGDGGESLVFTRKK